MTLPTLPIPAMKPFVIGDCYTTEQMLQFQRDTVDACADLCELFDATDPKYLAAEMRRLLK